MFLVFGGVRVGRLIIGWLCYLWDGMMCGSGGGGAVVVRMVMRGRKKEEKSE